MTGCLIADGIIPDALVCTVSTDNPAADDGPDWPQPVESTNLPQPETDPVSEPLSLDESVKFLGHFCGESIVFTPRKQPYIIRDRIVVNDPYNGDQDDDKISLFIDTNGQAVTLDATSLAPDSCALELNINRIKFGPMRLIHSRNVHPVCDFGKDNDLSNITVEIAE
ncbi:hypothetical protein WME94_14630 [Sorangium sp. So ce429]